MPSLDWAASRFELGAERGSLIEALSDYLLALRGLLEGGGAARTTMSARVAALACEPYEREQGRVTVERALAIERKLMSGGRYRPVAGASPLDVIAELEELLRRLLKGLATGELGGDLRAAADEVLLSEGLSATHVETPGIGETAEWRLPDPTPDDALDLSAIADGNLGDEEITVHRAENDDGTETNQMDDLSVRGAEEDRQPTTRIVVDDVELPDIMSAEGDHRAPPRPDERGSRGLVLGRRRRARVARLREPRARSTSTASPPRTASATSSRCPTPRTGRSASSGTSASGHKAADFRSEGRSPNPVQRARALARY